MFPPPAGCPAPRCSKPPYRGQQLPCGAHHCPRCGIWVRRKKATEHIRSLKDGDEYFTFPLRLNKRMNAAALGKVVKAVLRRVRDRLPPGATCCAFVHVEGSCEDGRSPIPHLHLFVAAPKGTISPELLMTLIQTGRLRAKTMISTEARFGSWEVVRCPQAMLLYLYRARREDRWVPPQEMPRRGDRYRLVYGYS